MNAATGCDKRQALLKIFIALRLYILLIKLNYDFICINIIIIKAAYLYVLIETICEMKTISMKY